VTVVAMDVSAEPAELGGAAAPADAMLLCFVKPPRLSGWLRWER
jgi:hypothetical protein